MESEKRKKFNVKIIVLLPLTVCCHKNSRQVAYLFFGLSVIAYTGILSQNSLQIWSIFFAVSRRLLHEAKNCWQFLDDPPKIDAMATIISLKYAAIFFTHPKKDYSWSKSTIATWDKFIWMLAMEGFHIVGDGLNRVALKNKKS